jgi:hypothetical protein
MDVGVNSKARVLLEKQPRRGIHRTRRAIMLHGVVSIAASTPDWFAATKRKLRHQTTPPPSATAPLWTGSRCDWPEADGPVWSGPGG